MNMSFMLTTKQMYDGTKDITRRLGWEKLKPESSGGGAYISRYHALPDFFAARSVLMIFVAHISCNVCG